MFIKKFIKNFLILLLIVEIFYFIFTHLLFISSVVGALDRALPSLMIIGVVMSFWGAAIITFSQIEMKSKENKKDDQEKI